MQMPPMVTERAFERLVEIGASGQGMGLRVAVEGGGCSGFQYDIKLDQACADDLVPVSYTHLTLPTNREV